MPGSTGIAVPHDDGATDDAVALHLEPAGAPLASTTSFGQARLEGAARACARSLSRSCWFDAFACAATSRKPAHAVAILPMCSLQSARLNCVPSPAIEAQALFELRARLGVAPLLHQRARVVEEALSGRGSLLLLGGSASASAGDEREEERGPERQRRFIDGPRPDLMRTPIQRTSTSDRALEGRNLADRR